MKNNKETTSWVIKNKTNGMFFNRDNRYSYTKKIKNARLFPSRQIARNCIVENECVRKVLTHNNIAVDIIR